MRVNSSSARIRDAFAKLEHERSQAVAAELRRLGVPHIRLGTDEDWLLELGRRLP